MKKEKGILLIAIGSSYYGRSAYNLAVSIRANTDLPIVLVHDNASIADLSDKQKELFTDFIVAPIGNGDMNQAMNLRLSLPKITPFIETLSLDVDMAWMPDKDPIEVFNVLNNCDISYANEGYYDIDNQISRTTPNYSGWADPKEIAEAYKLTGKLYHMRAEFIVFRNTDTVKKAFAMAKKIQAKPLILPYKLGGAVTEEFALNIAFNQLLIEPHTTAWKPTYWALLHGRFMLPIHKLKEEVYALSTGGNIITAETRSTYNLIMQAAAYKIGHRHVFPLVAKKNKLISRKNA